MDRTTQWISLLGGLFLFFLGLRSLYREGDWVLLVIGLFIMAFSVSSMMKSRQK